MAEVVYELMICGCCLRAIANGEDCPCGDDSVQHPDGLAAFKGVPSGIHWAADCRTDPSELDDPADAIYHGALCDDFDHHQCAGCGTWLAGDRHRVAGLSTQKASA